MSVVFVILLWLLLAVMVLVGLVLITPVLLRVHLTNSPQFAYRVEMHAVGGLAPRLMLARGPRHSSGSAHKTKLAKPKRRKSSRSGRVDDAFVRALPRLIRDILRHVHLTELHIDADYGLSDPADTGQLSGLLMPLQYTNPLPASVSLNLRPDFTQPCLKGSLTTAIRVTVAACFVPALRFAWRAFGPGR